MHIFICEDSPDGILTGVYEAWSAKISYGLSHSDIRLISAVPDNYELFCEYHNAAPDSEKAQKVSSTLRRRLGQEFFETILTAALAADVSAKKKKTDKADAIYHTIAAALCSPDGAHVLEHLSDPYVYRVFELSRAAASEAHHLKGFLRFSELKNGVLFARIHPKNNALPILAEHFTDRFPLENFMIYDETHRLAAIHRAGKDYMLVDTVDLNPDMLHPVSENEAHFCELWLTFFENIAIGARVNPKLQAKNLPKRFWADTPELRRRL